MVGVSAQVMGKVAIKRVYEEATDGDGFRVLVDRIWPRGMTRERARVDLWLKSAAPSTALRKWFDHDPAKWKEFKRRYAAELVVDPEGLDELAERVRRGPLTLVYSATDPVHNQAAALQEFLERRIGPGSGGNRG